MAALAGEVMVVNLGAEPVAALCAVVCELVDHAMLVQERERPIDGCEANPFAVAAPEPSPQRLRRRVVCLGGELREHEEAAPRGPNAVPLEERTEIAA
jgi:hypothetical protein